MISKLVSFLKIPFGQRREPADIPRKVRCFEAEYFPLLHLSLQEHKLVWTKQFQLTKKELDDHITADLQHIFIPTAKFPTELFKLHWAYSDVPSLRHWQALPEEALFQIDARISPLIPNSGRSAVMIPLFDFSEFDTLMMELRSAAPASL